MPIFIEVVYRERDEIVTDLYYLSAAEVLQNQALVDVSSFLHRDDTKMIFLVDPHQEVLLVVVPGTEKVRLNFILYIQPNDVESDPEKLF